MKKIICILAIFLFFTGLNYSYAKETKASDYEIAQPAAENQEETVVNEKTNVAIFKLNSKYGLKYNDSGKIILNAEWDEIIAINDNEYKLIKDNKAGYINLVSKSTFLTPYDDISVTGDYVKIKNDGKYGLVDKSGNVLLPPSFQSVNVIKSDGKEYLTGKVEGKYRFYQNTGKLIPEEELYTITPTKEYLLANDLLPVFKTKYQTKVTTYEKEINNDNLVYEIQEVKSTGKVKAKFIKNNSKLPMRGDKIVQLEKPTSNFISINNKDYILNHKDGKIGLNNKSGVEIIPTNFDTISIKKPCKHFFKSIVLAQKGGFFYIYDLKGNLKALQNSENITVYENNKVYVYYNGIITLDDKHIGTITKNGNKYLTKNEKFKRVPHKVNELILTILSDCK